MAHLISWFEIPVKNFDQAAEFYGKVLSRKIEIFNFNGARHGVLAKYVSEVGGAIVETEDFEPNKKGPLLYLRVVDLYSALEAVTKNGGKIIMEKTLIRNENLGQNSVVPHTQIDGKIGYIAKFEDPDGNILGLHGNS